MAWRVMIARRGCPQPLSLIPWPTRKYVLTPIEDLEGLPEIKPIRFTTNGAKISAPRIGRTGRQRKPRKLTRSLLQRPHRWADHAECARPSTRPCPMRRQFRTPTHVRSLASVSQPWHQRPVWTQGQTECRSSGRLGAEPSRGPRHLKATCQTRERGGSLTRRLGGASISATWIGSEVDILRRSSKPKGWPSRDTVCSLLEAHRSSYSRPG